MTEDKVVHAGYLLHRPGGGKDCKLYDLLGSCRATSNLYMLVHKSYETSILTWC